MKRIVSGMQATGIPTLGNYIGAMKQFVAMQNEMNDCEFLFFIANLHSITQPITKKELLKNTREIAALYIACGLDPKRVTIFIQSEVLEHTALGFIMESTSYIGEMERMTQFKEKRQKQQLSGVRTSLLTYPALMAADILLYDATLVPVGDDQQQHLELTKLLAERFNKNYGNTFIVPQALITKNGARIMSLNDPTRKMSKSDDNPKSYISLLDDLNQAKNKIKSAVTDSEAKIYFDEINKPGISNLLTIYSALTNKTIKELETTYENKSYQELKTDLSQIVYDTLQPIQTRFNELISGFELDEILTHGAESARQIAQRKLKQVYNKIGLSRK